MARKNRKLAKGGNGKVGGAIGAFLGVSLAMLGYLQLQSTCEETGKRIKELERSRDALVKKVETEEVVWSAASSVRNMEGLLERHGIQMGWPKEEQIIRVVAVRDEGPWSGGMELAKK